MDSAKAKCCHSIIPADVRAVMGNTLITGEVAAFLSLSPILLSPRHNSELGSGTGWYRVCWKLWGPLGSSRRD